MHRFAELTIVGLLHLARLSAPAPPAPIAPLGLHTYKQIAYMSPVQPAQPLSHLETVYVPPPPPAPVTTYSGTGDYYLDKIVNFESSGNPYAINPIGACGLFQALPCSKLGCDLSDIQCQINWGGRYCISTYGSTAAAWQHELNYHWY